MKSARLYVCLSIALCFLLLILNQTSGCCLTTLGGSTTPGTPSLLPAVQEALLTGNVALIFPQ